jgi:type II secretory pathway component PulK
MATSMSVRVDARTYERARRLAAAEDVSVGQVIARAIADAEERAFWRAYQDGMARLKRDPHAWSAYQVESRELDGTLADGLEPDEDWRWLEEAAAVGDLGLSPPGADD